VLLLEDLHWSDFSTLELISAIAQRRDPARLLVVGTYRPVEVLTRDHPLRTMKQELDLHGQCEELRLKLLSKDDIAQYLNRRLAGGGSHEYSNLAPVIHGRTDGNPLFMVNIVDYLLGKTGLAMSARDTNELEALAITGFDAPRNLRDMIERNLERLMPEEQSVLEGASVVGAEFSAASVAAALERSQDEIEACCTRLSRREQFVSAQGPVTWPDGTIATGFRFHHALYQEVLYGRLPAGHQLRLHQRIALREEAGYGERAIEVAPELAYHYSRANDKDKAVQYFKLAGERAVTRGAAVEAEEQFRCALNLLVEMPQTIDRDRRELELQMALGNVLWSSRSWAHPEAARAYTRAQELGENIGDTSQLVGMLRGIAVSALGAGQFKAAHEVAEKMLEAAERAGDRAALCAAHTFLGQALLWRAQYREAQRHFTLGDNYYDDTGTSEAGLVGIDAPALSAITTLLLGFPSQARELLKTALQRAKRCKAHFWVGLIHLWSAFISCELNDSMSALEHAQTISGLAATQPVWSGLADIYMARALMLQGSWEVGKSYLQQAVAFLKEIGLQAELIRTKLDESEIVAHQGQVDEAISLVNSAIVDSEELAQIKCRAKLRRAELLAQCVGDIPIVETAYRDAIESAQMQGAKYYELISITSFARWLDLQNRAPEAQTILAEIYQWFTEGFDVSALKEAKILLDELSSKTSVNMRHKSRKGRSGGRSAN
jgi:tetratricopeptide (TPR) repeat protein